MQLSEKGNLNLNANLGTKQRNSAAGFLEIQDETRPFLSAACKEWPVKWRFIVTFAQRVFHPEIRARLYVYVETDDFILAPHVNKSSLFQSTFER